MARNLNGANPDSLNPAAGVRGNDLLGILVMIWVKFDRVNVPQNIFSRWGPAGSTSQQWLLDATTNGGGVTAEFQMMDTSFVAHTVTGTSILTTGVWYHIAGMFVGTPNFTSYVFVNGTLENSLNVGAALNQNNITSTAVYIGLDNYAAPNNFPLYGSVAEATLQVVNTNLSAVSNYERVVAQNAQGASMTQLFDLAATSEIFGYWACLGDSPETDYAGGGIAGGQHNATLTGTTVVNHPGVTTLFTMGRSHNTGSGSGIS